MIIDPENPINKLCAEGIALEGSDLSAAGKLYLQAWNEAVTDAEKSTSAHYLARVQTDVAGKLDWDQIALKHGLLVENEALKNALLPSLYLNVAKGLEDSGNVEDARKHYEMGLTASEILAEDGYVQLIKNGLRNGIARVS